MVSRVGRTRRVGIHEQHEPHVATRDETVDVVVLECVDSLEVSNKAISVVKLGGGRIGEDMISRRTHSSLLVH